jgi:DNA-binding transcriptional ArsR family regulator
MEDSACGASVTVFGPTFATAEPSESWMPLFQSLLMRDQNPDLQSILALDRMVHEPARLAILTVLSAAAEVEFLFLQRITGLSKGNLSSHTQKLESAGYLQTLKAFRGRIPVTSFRITAEGTQALRTYHRQLRELLPRQE